MKPLVSIFASANRPALWRDFTKYVTYPEIEVVFAGPVIDVPDFPLCNFKYIRTGNIKPATAYELSRRACTGEVVVVAADDCEFINNILLIAYDYWKKQGNEKLILSLQTKESGYGAKDGKLFNMNEHRFFSFDPDSPLMAPIFMMSREFLNELGGIDQRYVCGQYENDIVMRAYQQGATVEIFGNKDLYVDIDHLRKSIQVGESTNEEDFLNRPFASSYSKDREVLEMSWSSFDEREMFKRLDRGERLVSMRQVSKVQLDAFEPYPEVIPLDYSLSNKGKWI